ncbi:MAG: tRNA pseudouridine(38-40) synthase TruA [Desulfovibrio sp.]|nr:tRNA pseudouridine(38-40) synthase TruA [Desulfovibrio sp.]MCA1985935.1 tRNA pseudouridine(38-40) synthase TruA [Desulfovibrio sp.]
MDQEYRRLKLTLAYNGARFQGWQLQAPTLHGKPQRTVQGVLEDAVQTVCETHIRVHGSSRTDAGVHALGQVCHLDIPASKWRVDWQLALNGLLPREVQVVNAAWVDPGFHARFDAVSKRYAYRFWCSRRYVLPQRRPYVWTTDPLDLARMDAAARHFVGEHDFAAFTNAGSDTKGTVRTVTRLERVPGCCQHPLEHVWHIEATGFLKQMVRNIMGCLREVGRGKLEPEAVRSLLAGRERTKAPCCAPAQGLTLEEIFFRA